MNIFRNLLGGGGSVQMPVCELGGWGRVNTTLAVLIKFISSKEMNKPYVVIIIGLRLLNIVITSNTLNIYRQREVSLFAAIIVIFFL
jgi:hypothetical protein